MDYLVKDAARLDRILAKKKVTVADLDEVLVCYQFSLLAQEEIAMLDRLVTLFAQVKTPLKDMQTILDYAKKRSHNIASFKSTAGHPGYSASENSIKVQAALQKLRLKDGDKKHSIKTVLAYVKKNAFDWRAVIHGVEAYSLADEPERALNLFARAFFLRTSIGLSVHKNPVLKTLVEKTDLKKKLNDKSLCPKVYPCKFFGVTKVTVKYVASKFRTKIDETRTISWQKDRFIEDTNKVAISGSVVKALLRIIKASKPAQIIRTRMTMGGEPPSTLVRIERKGKEPILLFSSSDDQEMFPYNVAIGSKLRYLATGDCGKILAFLRIWLAMSELRRGYS